MIELTNGSLDRQEPIKDTIPKDFLEIITFAQTPSSFIRTGGKVRRPELFKGRSVLKYQVNVVPKQWWDRNTKHNADKKEKKDVKFALAFGGLGIAEAIGPKLNKVSEYTTCQEYGVSEGVAQKQHEKFVVIEGHAVVHPGTVVVESVHAPMAESTMAAPGRSDHFTVGAKTASL